MKSLPKKLGEKMTEKETWQIRNEHGVRYEFEVADLKKKLLGALSALERIQIICHDESMSQSQKLGRIEGRTKSILENLNRKNLECKFT